MSLLTRDQIYAHLPHRPPILLIDAVTAWEPEKTMTATRHFTADDPLFAGHFPGNPILPGMLTLEAIAQVAALLISAGRNLSAETALYLFTGLGNARFKQVVRPGNTLTLRVDKENEKLNIFKFYGVASLEDGTMAAETTFSR